MLRSFPALLRPIVAAFQTHPEAHALDLALRLQHRMIFVGESHLPQSIHEYLEYYHRERNHQGLAGKILYPDAEIVSPEGEVCRRKRRGGMLNYYYREAA